MRRVYQRPPSLAAVTGLLVALACGAPEPLPPAAARHAAAPLPLSVALDVRSHALAALATGAPGIAATEISPAATGVLALPGQAGKRGRPIVGTAGCRLQAIAPGGDRLLLACVESAGGETLRLVEPRLGGPGAIVARGGERPLAWSADGTLWIATVGATEEPERLVALGNGTLRRSVFTAPPGFAIAAVAPDAALALLHREVHPEAHEVVLHDWRDDASRLLLPSGEDGRFTDLAFVEGGDAVRLFADDGRDAPRLERLDLSSGDRRPWGELPCPPLAERSHADGSATVVVLCGDGRRSAVRLAADGRAAALPEIASGTRIVDWLPDGGGGTLLLTAGERYPREVARADPASGFRPLTYGLPGRVDPDALPEPKPRRWTNGGVELPAELWPTTTAAAVVIWFGPADRPPDFGVHRPLVAALASRGVATLVVRGRGDASPSRRLRRAADGDPFAAAWSDLRAAHAATAALASPAAPRLLVGEGDWWGAAAIAFAAVADSPYAATFALFPALDPVAEWQAVAMAEEPLRGHLAHRWGEPEERALATRRAAWSFAVESARRPLWIALDERDESGPAAAARLAAARAAGAPVEAFAFAPRALADRLPDELERRLVRRLLAAARDAPR